MRRDDDEILPGQLLEDNPFIGTPPLLPSSSGFSFIAAPGGSPSATPPTPLSPPGAGAAGVGGFLNSIFSLPGVTDSTTTPEIRGTEIQRDLGLNSLLSSSWLAEYDNASGTITISEKPSSMPFFGNKATIPLCRLDPRSQTVEIINPEKKAFQEAAKVAAAIAQKAQATGAPCELHIYDNTPGTITLEGLVEIVKELRSKGITSFKVEQTLLNRVGGPTAHAELAGVQTYVAPRPATPVSSTATPPPPSTFPTAHASPPSTPSPPPPSSIGSSSPIRGGIVEDLDDDPSNTPEFK